MFQDYLFFAVDTKVYYSYRMLHLSSLAEELKAQHKLNNNRALLLSNAVLGSVLLSSVLDYEERINLRIHSGIDFTIGTETTFQAETKAYIECNEESELTKKIDAGLDVFPEIYVRSARSQRNKTALFQGTTVSHNSDIENAINEHLKSSYQMSTFVKINSWIDKETNKINAFGVIFQELPGIPENVSAELTEHIKSLPSIKDMYLQNSDPDLLSQKIIPHETKAVKSINPKLVCHCSQDKVESALFTIPVEDLQDILSKKENIEMKCHYCSTNYNVSIERIEQIFAGRVSSQNNNTNLN